MIWASINCCIFKTILINIFHYVPAFNTLQYLTAIFYLLSHKARVFYFISQISGLTFIPKNFEESHSRSQYISCSCEAGKDISLIFSLSKDKISKTSPMRYLCLFSSTTKTLFISILVFMDIRLDL